MFQSKKDKKAEPVQTTEKKVEPVKRSPKELLIRDLIGLLIKIVAIATFTVFIFTFMFGVYRSLNPSMAPSIQDGDLVFYYRLDKMYSNSDVLVASYEGETLALRVVAVAGDEVDVKNGSLYVNGSRQQETRIYEETHRFEEGVEFPLVVQPGQVFVLGDSRENSTDSRIFGPVEIADTHGKVIAIIRRRNI